MASAASALNSETEKVVKVARVLHVAPWFWPAASFGGPIESTYQLCRHLAQFGCEVQVVTTDVAGLNRDRLHVANGTDMELVRGLSVRYCRRRAGISFSPEMLSKLAGYLRWAEVVHLTAAYNAPTIPTLLACRRLKKPLVWSPRGAFQRWAGSRRPHAKNLWDIVCRVLLPPHATIHVTSNEEAKSAAVRFPGTRIRLITNGVVIPDAPMHEPGDPHRLRLLYLGRLDPKKGIENLLDACHLLKGGNDPVFFLAIAGDGDSRYAAALRGRIAMLGLSQHVKMIGEVREERKERAFACADVLVMPSYTENFGIVAAEALAREVPVIAGRGTPWSELESVGCGLWVANDPKTLAEAIMRIAAMPRAEMGERGRRWMAGKFSWRLIAAQMLKCYEDAARAI